MRGSLVEAKIVPSSIMFDSTSRILISATPECRKEPDDKNREINPQISSWMLTIERHKRIPLRKLTSDRLHYSAIWDHGQKKYVLQNTNRSPPSVASYIVIGDTRCSNQEITRILENKTCQYNAATPWESTPRQSSKSWIWLALYALMEDGATEHFDIREFMSFAQSFFDSRLECSAGTALPSVVSYSKINGTQLPKMTGSGRWTSFTFPAVDRSGDLSYGRLI